MESNGASDLHHYSIVRPGEKNSMFTKIKHSSFEADFFFNYNYHNRLRLERKLFLETLTSEHINFGTHFTSFLR